jgi:hypothetical protein
VITVSWKPVEGGVGISGDADLLDLKNSINPVTGSIPGVFRFIESRSIYLLASLVGSTCSR